MHGLGYNRFAAKYLSQVKVGGGTFPAVTTPWMVNKFAADTFKCFSGQIYAMWPLIGGTADAHAADLFGNNTITWSGTVTHNANGATGNGTTGYGETAKNANKIIPTPNYSFGVYSRTSSGLDVYEVGCAIGSGTAMTIQCRTTTNFVRGWPSPASTYIEAAAASGAGLVTVTRKLSLNGALYKNGSLMGSQNSTCNGNVPSAPWNLCAYWFQSASTRYYTSRNFALAFIGGPDLDVASFYAVNQAFQTHLGRQV